MQNIYRTLRVPIGLIKKIDEMIKNSKGDYTSRTDVVKYAVRRQYEVENEKDKRYP